MEEAELMLQDVNKRHHKLSDWEHGFIDSINLINDLENLSPKQYETLEKIWDKVT